MDDPELGHVTVAGIASFDSVSSWFSIDDPEEVRRRLRVTLEIAGLNPFAEDGLFTEIGRVVRFQGDEWELHSVLSDAYPSYLHLLF